MQTSRYSSERVWTGISTSLHSRRKWYGAGLALLLFTATTVTLVMLNTNDRKSTIAATQNLSQKVKTEKKLQNIAIVAPAKKDTKTLNSESNAITTRLKTIYFYQM